MLGRLKSAFSNTTLEPAEPGKASDRATAAQSQIAIFAGGCFWGVEHIFLKHFSPAKNKGIISTAVGYTGGVIHHAEAVKIKFDPSIVTYEELVEFFYRIHDPTTLNRQGADVGAKYRSAIFTTSDDQVATAKRVTEEIQAKHFTPKGKKIVTEIARPGRWLKAQSYHQMYLFKHPNGYHCPTHRLHW